MVEEKMGILSFNIHFKNKQGNVNAKLFENIPNSNDMFLYFINRGHI